MRLSSLAGVVLAFGLPLVPAGFAEKAPQQDQASGHTAISVPLTGAKLAGSKQTSAQAKAVVAKPKPLVPLGTRERALQMIDRFSYGPRPGDLDRIAALGADRWFAQQLNPQSISDGALDKRLADYPSLAMTPAETVLHFPFGGTISDIANGKQPYPSDPLLKGMYEVAVYKHEQQQDLKKPVAAAEQGSAIKQGVPPSEVDPAEAAAKAAVEKQAGQALAAHIAGELFALPKPERMAALMKMPVMDRIAFTSYVAGDQKNLLLADFSPRERELFRGMANNGGNGNPGDAGQELAEAKMLRAILTERQVQEVMTDFWFNHFNIYVGKDSDQWYTTSYERDVIRPNALGKFKDLLLATAQSPAMMIYLDNWLSIGPDSLANGVNPANPKLKKGNKGLNENYGREVMELHTVGVGGGYSQADVTSLASILTGWTVDRPGQGGPFLFDPKKHEPGDKQWFGHTIKAGEQEEGIEALTLLAESPKTAQFISFLLAQRFVADVPPPALVDRLTKSYLASDGDIRVVLRALVQSPEFNSTLYFRNKVKTPVEFIASAFRTTLTNPTNVGAVVQTVNNMGERLYYALPPTGYYITADKWMNTGALVDRLNFAYKLTTNGFGGQKFDSAHLLALAILAQHSPVSDAKVSGRDTNFTPAALAVDANGAVALPTGVAGMDVVLSVLEGTLIGEKVSAQTNELIHKEMDQPAQQNSNPSSTLNVLTALVLGSPEFQVR